MWIWRGWDIQCLVCSEGEDVRVGVYTKKGWGGFCVDTEGEPGRGLNCLNWGGGLGLG